MPVQSLHYGFDPYGYFGRARDRFGDVFTARVMGETWVVLAHPDAVREVFAHGPEELDSGVANLPLRPILGTRNVLLLDGDAHLRRRRIVLPPFHGDRMRAYGDLVREAAVRELATWRAGEVRAALPGMRRITFEAILGAVFGVDDPSGLARLRTVLSALLTWTTDIRRAFVFVLLGPERLMGMPSFRRQLAAVDAEVFAEIARRRGDPALAGRQDILSLLLQAHDESGQPLTDREMRDELVTLLVAGHETTAALLGWAVHELARAPELQSRVAAGEDGLTDAVVQETLRLHPPVPLVVRRLREPLHLAGHTLPRGTTVAPCMVLVHRRPELYPDPEAFRPGRFLSGRPPAGAFLPFGGGVRRCVGAAFAQFEARLVLEEMMGTLDLRPASRRRERVGRRGIVIVPLRGARVVPRPRPARPQAAAGSGEASAANRGSAAPTAR